MTRTIRLGARVDIGPVTIAGWVYDLYLTSTGDGDMVTIYVRGLQPSRMGTVHHPAAARVEDVHLTEAMFAYRLDQWGKELVAGIREAYARWSS